MSNSTQNQLKSANRKKIIKNNSKRYRIWWRQIKKFICNTKKKCHYNYDYYSEETDIESEDEHTNNEDSNDKVIIKKKKH